MSTEPENERLTIPLWPDAGKILGLGRSATYDAAARGEIPVIRIGRRKIVPIKRLERMINGDTA
jgi:hypothetical protein